MSSRRIVIQTLIITIALVFAIRLFSIQIVDDDYKLAAQNNIIQKIVEYPYRGLVYDRDNNLVVYNTPVYDLMIVPKEVDLEDSTEICALLGITNETFMNRYTKARRYSSILSSTFEEQIPDEEFAKIQDKLVDIPGIYPLPRTVREYPENTLSNALGYVREISRAQLNRDTSGYYQPGDYTGIKGIELEYEEALRGKRGMSYKIVNVQGVVKGAFKNGELDSSATPGKSIKLTIDSKLQRYAEYLMAGKVGSVVALDPNTGEILAYVSAPSYDPNLLSGRNLGPNFLKLQGDSLKPLFNRPIQAMYPPGSMFKTVQTLVAMQEGLLGPYEKILCDYSPMGDHAPKGVYDVDRAIALSSNTFLYKVFRRVILQNQDPNVYIDSRIGLENWTNQVHKFGLGHTLGVDLPGEKAGNVPTAEYYDRVYGSKRWKFSNIYSLSIGQGEMQVTPIQMANLGAILGNKGYYYTPHIVREVDGEPVKVFPKNDTGVKPEYFEPVIKGMENTVLRGTGLRAYIPEIPVCGKTSTVENPHGEDHSGFVAFAPKDNPQISIAVYVENAGQGARAAAATAGLLMEKYLKGEITRPFMEEYVLRGDFSDPRPRRIKADSTKQEVKIQNDSIQ